MRLRCTRPVVLALSLALAMGAAAYVSYQFLYAKIASNTIATAGAILIGAVLYLVGVLWMRMFTQEDLIYIPGGAILAKLQFRRK